MVAVFATMSLVVTGCSKDDDGDTSGNIVGTWENVSELSSSLGVTNYVQFNANGSYYEVNVLSGFGKVEVLHGNWSQSGSTITVSGGNVTAVTATVKSVSNSSLILETMGISQTYKKVEDSTIEKYL